MITKTIVDITNQINNFAFTLFDYDNQKIKVSNDFHINKCTTHLKQSRCSSWWGDNVINLHLFVRLLITCSSLSTTWLLIWLYLSYLAIYAYLCYHSSIFRWNPLRSPSPLTTTHSLLYYSFYLHSDSCQVFSTICSSYLALTIGWLDTSLIPTYSNWMIVYLLILWTLTYLVSWLITYCVHKTLSYAIEHQSWAGLSS